MSEREIGTLIIGYNESEVIDVMVAVQKEMVELGKGDPYLAPTVLTDDGRIALKIDHDFPAFDSLEKTMNRLVDVAGVYGVVYHDQHPQACHAIRFAPEASESSLFGANLVLISYFNAIIAKTRKLRDEYAGKAGIVVTEGDKQEQQLGDIHSGARHED